MKCGIPIFAIVVVAIVSVKCRANKENFHSFWGHSKTAPEAHKAKYLDQHVETKNVTTPQGQHEYPSNFTEDGCNFFPEIVFVQDISASYEDDMVSMRLAMPNLFEFFEKEYKGQVRFSIVSFIDKPIEPWGFPEDWCARVDLPLTAVNSKNSLDLAKDVFYNLGAGGGNDWYDGATEAMFRVAASDSVGWSNNPFDKDTGARIARFLVLATDAASHMPRDFNETDTFKLPPHDFYGNPEMREVLNKNINARCNETDYPNPKDIGAVFKERGITPIVLAGKQYLQKETSGIRQIPMGWQNHLNLNKPLSEAWKDPETGLAEYYKWFLKSEIGVEGVVEVIDNASSNFTEVFRKAMSEVSKIECKRPQKIKMEGQFVTSPKSPSELGATSTTAAAQSTNDILRSNIRRNEPVITNKEIEEKLGQDVESNNLRSANRKKNQSTLSHKTDNILLADNKTDKATDYSKDNVIPIIRPHLKEKNNIPALGEETNDVGEYLEDNILPILISRKVPETQNDVLKPARLANGKQLSLSKTNETQVLNLEKPISQQLTGVIDTGIRYPVRPNNATLEPLNAENSGLSSETPEKDWPLLSSKTSTSLPSVGDEVVSSGNHSGYSEPQHLLNNVTNAGELLQSKTESQSESKARESVLTILEPLNGENRPLSSETQDKDGPLLSSKTSTSLPSVDEVVSSGNHSGYSEPQHLLYNVTNAGELLQSKNESQSESKARQSVLTILEPLNGENRPLSSETQDKDGPLLSSKTSTSLPSIGDEVVSSGNHSGYSEPQHLNNITNAGELLQRKNESQSESKARQSVLTILEQLNGENRPLSSETQDKDGPLLSSETSTSLPSVGDEVVSSGNHSGYSEPEHLNNERSKTQSAETKHDVPFSKTEIINSSVRRQNSTPEPLSTNRSPSSRLAELEGQSRSRYKNEEVAVPFSVRENEPLQLSTEQMKEENLEIYHKQAFPGKSKSPLLSNNEETLNKEPQGPATEKVDGNHTTTTTTSTAAFSGGTGIIIGSAAGGAAVTAAAAGAFLVKKFGLIGFGGSSLIDTSLIQDLENVEVTQDREQFEAVTGDLFS